RSLNSTWPLAMDLYLPHAWAEDDARREIVMVPRAIVGKKKWELALGQISRAKREGFVIRGVTADAGYGDVGDFRDGIARLGLRYVVRVGGKQIAFRERPRYTREQRNDRGRRPITLAKGTPIPVTLRQLARSIPDKAFRSLIWGKGSKGSLRIRVAALRGFLAGDCQKGALPKECWLLIRRKRDGSHKLYLSNLAADASPMELVKIAYSRWAVEQSYQQLKDDLGFDHFEGRSWPGWNHHAVLTAMAFTFLALERRRSRRARLPTIPALRRVLSRLTLAMTVVE